jgi:hypothetical protein
VAVDRRGLELDVVDADDLAAMDVDDLLVEEVALEQQHAVARRKSIPPARVGRRPDRRARRLDFVVRQHPLAVGGPDDEEGDPGGMVLRGHRDLAHATADGAGGVSYGGAEQLGQRDDRHRAIVACDQWTCDGIAWFGRQRRNT